MGTRPPDRLVVVHMGLPKTGTTFLQERVFARHSGILNLAKPWKRNGGENPLRDLLHLLSEGTEQEYAPMEIRIAERLGALTRAPEPAGRCAMISYEGLYHPRANDPLENLERLSRMLPGPFNVLITVREQMSWMESLYLYAFKKFASFTKPLRAGAPDFRRFCAQERSRPWNIFTCCDYWGTIRRIVSKLGTDRVLVVPMEAMFSDSGDYFSRRMPDFMNLDPSEFGALTSDREKIKERIPEYGYVLGRAVHMAQEAGLDPADMKTLAGLFEQIHRWALGQKEAMPAGVPADLREYWTAEELRRLEIGNAELAKFCGVDLARWGYLLP